MNEDNASMQYKPWTAEDDIQIIINADKSDAALAYDFQRGPTAIHWRRATLAAYMHKLCPEVSLQCCCLRVKGNINLATTILSESTLEEVLDSSNTALRNIVLRLAARTPVADDSTNPIKPLSPTSSDYNYFKMPVDCVDTSNTCATLPCADRDTAELCTAHYNIHLEAVKAISQLVRSENGRLQKVWDDPDMVPYMIMYYPGFQALSTNIIG